MLLHCIRLWFGSEAEFDQMCRSICDLSTDLPFPVLHGRSLPGPVGVGLSSLSAEEGEYAPYAIHSLGYFLSVGPVFVALKFLAQKWQQPVDKQRQDVAMNFLVVLLVF